MTNVDSATRSSSSATHVHVGVSELLDLVSSIFVNAGLSIDAARIVAEGLVEADREGISSHGVMLVPMYVERIKRGSVSRGSIGRIVVNNDSVAVLDAENVLGQLTARQAVEIAAEKARIFGMGAVAVRNGFHFGAAGQYAAQLAARKMVGIVMCNTRPLMPAPGGAEPVVGNNPIAIAVPSDGQDSPLVLDMATSATAMGRIRLAAAIGETIPKDWATDASGVPTDNPSKAIDAAMLLPAGGAKGFGLAFMIDVLCGGLSSGAMSADVRPLFDDLERPYGCSHLFLAIDIPHFRDPADFEQAIAGATRRVRESRPAAGTRRPMVPGEPAWRNRAKNKDGCDVEQNVVLRLRELAERV